MSVNNRSKHIISILQLMGMLCLLFWSFTWNSPTKYYISEPKKSLKIISSTTRKSVSEILSSDVISSQDREQRSNFVEQFKTVKYIGNSEWKAPSAGNSFLPSFNVWKEEQSRREIFEVSTGKRTTSKGRKLNYASSKCGAKILASNPEVKHRFSVLNEKVDEYLLNPCKKKAWFIIELCDAVEATQIELANYELYSSSPKEFLVFWSDVYPTQKWHHLAAFEAKDQRSMQTFDLKARNLGKFIKVIVLSHHGREHFCPISVFRVIGYSMVYDVEEDVSEENLEPNSTHLNDFEKNHRFHFGHSNQANSTLYDPIKNSRSSLISIEKQPPVSYGNLCQLKQRYCSFSVKELGKTICDYSLACSFTQELILYSRQNCMGALIYLKTDENLDLSFFSSDSTKNKMRYSVYSSLNDISSKIGTNMKSTLEEKAPSVEKNVVAYSINFSRSVNSSPENLIPNDFLKKTESSGSIIDVLVNSYNSNEKVMNDNENPPKSSSIYSKLKSTFQKNGHNAIISKECKNCDCYRISELQNRPDQGTKVPVSKLIEIERRKEDGIESAALIQKESVLVKLTWRIKSLEQNLNLINRYLQELSEYYRKQIEDTFAFINTTTVKMKTAAAKEQLFDQQQELMIENLKEQVHSLSEKIVFLNGGRGDMLKRILELHGFFLILEFIIISTIFSIFLNNIRKATNISY